MKKPVAIIIMDGYGLAPAFEGNAIYRAKKPEIDGLIAKFPHTALSASGENVGLPAGQSGNGRSGHMNIGAGRIVSPESVIPPPLVFGEYISSLGLTQLRIGEASKFDYVTSCFNGGRTEAFDGEDRVRIPEADAAVLRDNPHFNAYAVCNAAVDGIKSGRYDVVIVNFASCDTAGHTGDFSGAVRAVEAVDACVGKTVAAVLEAGGIAVVTADHGNADKMLEEDGVTAVNEHTLRPVPFVIAGEQARGIELRAGRLCDVAPTVLHLMGLGIPAEMTGRSLIIE